MKKVKFMLLSLALVAVVGGALAFKAKFKATYCTTTPVEGICQVAGDNLPCTTTALNNVTTGGTADFLCYKVSNGIDDCTLQVCPQADHIRGN